MSLGLGHPEGLRVMREHFPECPDYIPWAMLTEAHAKRVEYNHCGQTIQRLNERGGLSPLELRAVIMDRDWYTLYSGSRGNGIKFEHYVEAVNFLRKFLGMCPLADVIGIDFKLEEWRKRMRL